MTAPANAAPTNAGRPDLDRLVRASHIDAREPVFLLRARDPAAAKAVRAWAVIAHTFGVPPAVIEEALAQADAMDAWPEKQVPAADHLSADERLQLEYRLDRRAWRARLADIHTSADIVLAERRGWAAAVARMRALQPQGTAA